MFFGLVIGGTLLAFWRWFDRAADAPMIDGGALAASARLTRLERQALSPLVAVLAAGALVAGPMVWVGAANGLHAPVPAVITLPDVPGWQRVDAPRAPSTQAWQPLAHGAVARVLGRYQNAQGAQVDVFIALYDGQGPGRKATTMGEGAVPALSGWAWQGQGQGQGPMVANAISDRMMNKQGVSRLAQTSYRTGEMVTGSRFALLLASARDRLALRARPVAMVIFSAPEPQGPAGSGVAAARALAAFRDALGPLGGWVDGICKGGARVPTAGD